MDLYLAQAVLNVALGKVDYVVVADDLPASALDLLRGEAGWVIDARSGRKPAALAVVAIHPCDLSAKGPGKR